MLKKFFHSIGANLIILVLATVQGIIIARVLNTDGKGEVAVYLSFYHIIYSFTNLGIRQSSSFFLSKKKWSNKLISNIHVIGFFISTFLTGIILLIGFIVQGIFNYQIFFYFLISLPFVLYTTFTTSFGLSFKWIEKLNYVKVLNAFIFLISLVTFYLLLGYQDVEFYFLSFFVTNFFTSFYVYSWAKKINGYSLKISFDKQVLFKYLKVAFKGISYALPLFVYGLNYKFDILILNSLVTNSEVGVYSVGVTFAELIWMLPAILSTLIFSYSVSNKDPNKFSKELWKKNKLIMILIIPVLICYFFIVDYFLPILYGYEFAGSSIITMYLLPGTYAIISFNILNADMAARGFPRVGLTIFSLSAILNIILNYIFIPMWGISGAAFASSLTYILASLVFLFRYYNLTSKPNSLAI
jgi:O-antigen/teichoic acid export membrane protein